MPFLTKLSGFPNRERDLTLIPLPTTNKTTADLRCSINTHSTDTTTFRHRNQFAEQMSKSKKAIDLSNLLHSNLLEAIPDAVVAIDNNLKITLWNHAATDLYGWSAEEVNGQSITTILDSDTISQYQKMYLAHLQDNEIWRGELTRVHKSGRVLQITTSVATIKDSNGHRVGLIAIDRDITTQKINEDRLLTLSSAVEQSPVSILITDTKGIIEYVNPKFTQLTGYSTEEAIGQNPRILKSGETSGIEYQELWQALTSGKPWQGQLHNRAKDGTLFWESALLSPIVNKNGQITHYLGIKEDISPQKQREKEQSALLNLAMALRAANGRAEMIPAILAQSSAIVDATLSAYATPEGPNNQLQIEVAFSKDYSNAEARLELARTHAVTRQALQTRQLQWTDNINQAGPATKSAQGIETAAQLPTTQPTAIFTDALVCVPLVAYEETLGVIWLFRAKGYTSEEIRILVAVADMVAIALHRAKLHDQVARYAADLESEVATRTQELRAANEKLRELDRLKSKFVSDVTHELRTPVTNIGLYLKLLERKPEKLGEFTKILNEQAERLRTLVKDTLDLSRLDQVKEEINLGDIDLNSFTANIVEAQMARAESQNLTLEFHPMPDLPTVRGDQDKLAQVITNLIVNALNYTMHGHIWVRTYQDEETKRLYVEVKDTGCGIHPEDIPHLFDRFYRGKREQMPPVPGTGLGLSIVKEIIEQHRGQVIINSEVGKGSTFTVSLPAHWA